MLRALLSSEEPLARAAVTALREVSESAVIRIHPYTRVLLHACLMLRQQNEDCGAAEWLLPLSSTTRSPLAPADRDRSVMADAGETGATCGVDPERQQPNCARVGDASRNRGTCRGKGRFWGGRTSGRPLMGLRRVRVEVDMDASGFMTWRFWREPQKPRTTDSELNARLSRLRSEVAQARGAGADSDSVDGVLGEFESRLKEAEKLAHRTADGSSQGSELKEECLRIAQEVEAELCMFKPAELLYPTWIRLRENLYRFDKRRRDAWDADITERISADLEEKEPDKLRLLRQRLRQLTLELQESALRFNRLNEERAAVTREVIDFGVLLVCVFAVLLVACLTLSTYTITDAVSMLVYLVAGMSAGGMGAVFSTFGDAPRRTGARKVQEDLEGGYALACVRGIRRCVTGGYCSVV